MILGIACLIVFTLATVDSRHGAWAAESAFDRLREQAIAEIPDQRDWSSGRKAKYLESQAAELGAPPGLIRIPSLDLTVPVFKGTDELVLNRGAGWIEGTAEIGSAGNVGLAGHRDGFFRGLKDLKAGDLIEVATLEGSLTYRVSEITIVDPEDVYVLAPTPEPSLTLVTCYPFYFVGNAPKRYIVRGVLQTGQPQMSDLVTGQGQTYNQSQTR
jgi:sortase A